MSYLWWILGVVWLGVWLTIAFLISPHPAEKLSGRDRAERWASMLACAAWPVLVVWACLSGLFYFNHRGVGYEKPSPEGWGR